MTLNEMIDDILLEARNNSISESEHLSRHQIELWINSYRAFLIKQDIDKGRSINPMYTQTIMMHLDKLENNPGHFVYKGDKKLPALIDFNFRPGVISVKDGYGNIIQIGSETKMKFQKYRKHTCKDYIAYVKSDYLYVEGNDILEYVDVEVIAENPTDLQMCYNPMEDQYPIPAAMFTTVKQLIFSRDIPTMLQTITDKTNDSNDDTQNKATK